MHVVLPEVDGRIFSGVTSFKEPRKKDHDLQFARFAHRVEPPRIEAITKRVIRWITLGQNNNADLTPAIVLSTYPGKDWQMAHAVGLDAIASTDAILDDLNDAGMGDPKCCAT